MVSPARSLPAPLHHRLTVVRAGASDDARQLAAGLVAALADLECGPLVDADALHDAARALAAEARERRLAERAAAVAARRELAARRTELLERAAWCEATGGTARTLVAAADEARARVEEARAAAQAAAARRERVAEQRAAAAAAVDEARLELESLDSASLDETGVRREIEAATRAEREALAAKEAAEAEVAALEEHLSGILAAAEELDRQLAEIAAEADRPDLAALERQVAAALGRFDELAARAGPDPGAAALADAIRRVDEELAELRRTTPTPPSDDEIEQAAAEVSACRRRLDQARAAAAAFDGPPPDWWVELNALHAEVADAEAALEGNPLRRHGARRRFEEAVARERARLDELGFESYLDALMSGGRLPAERAADEQRIADAAEQLAAAERRLERLQDDKLAGEPVAERLAERERLVHLATGILATDPGDRVLDLLAEHPAVPPVVIGELADALQVAGVDTTGTSVAEAARRWLTNRAAVTDPNRRAELERRRRELDSERHAVEQALAPARTVAQRAAEEAAAAHRTVAALESELQARAGDDAQLLERAAAAQALRDQVAALEERLAAAEADALQAWTRAAEQLAAAEAEQQRIERELADLRRRASRAAADLPPEHRPAFDLLTGLAALGGALRAEASALAAQLTDADAAVAAAEEAVSDAGTPVAEDLAGALDGLLAGGAGPVVLCEPFAGLAAATVEALLDPLLRASDRRPVVVVTADLTAIGWAIGLPGDTCSLVPARSVEPLLDAAAQRSVD